MNIPEDEYCKHEMLVGTCSTCAGKPKLQEVFAPVEYVMQAKFASICPVCDCQIDVGGRRSMDM